jgi:hypothetical protein
MGEPFPSGVWEKPANRQHQQAAQEADESKQVPPSDTEVTLAKEPELNIVPPTPYEKNEAQLSSTPGTAENNVLELNTVLSSNADKHDLTPRLSERALEEHDATFEPPALKLTPGTPKKTPVSNCFLTTTMDLILAHRSRRP